MPASTADLIDAVLYSAYSKKSTDNVDGSDDCIQNQHYPTVKQVDFLIDLFI